MLHRQRFVAAHSRTYIHAVAAAQTVEHVNLLHKFKTGEIFAYGRFHVFVAEGSGGLFVGIEQEGTDGSVRTNIRAAVALYAIILVPFRHKGCHAAFFVGCCALRPGAVNTAQEGAYGQRIAVLTVDGNNYVGDELGCVGYRQRAVGKFCPGRVNLQLVIFVAAVYGLIVHVDYILALLGVALNDEFLHLLNGQINWNDFRDAEEGRLKYGIGAVAKTYLLSYLRGVDIVERDVVLCQIFLDAVGQILGQLIGIPNGVEQESAAGLKTAHNVVHVQICLNMACHEIGRVHQIC